MYNLLAVISSFFVAAQSIHADSWKDTLPVMGIGMVGIFLVLGFIVLVTYLLNKAFSGKKKDKKDDDKNKK